MTPEFFERHIDLLDGWSLSQSNAMTPEFFERHLDKIDNRCWDRLSYNTAMTPEFFDRHIDRVEWENLSQNNAMTPEFFERHKDKVIWYRVSTNTSMTPEFFERHLDKVNWDILSGNTAMTPEFFDRHIDRVNWDNLSANDFSEYKKRLLRRCIQIRRLQRTCKIPNRYRLTKLIKTRVFCEWYYRGDNIGGIISKRRIQTPLSTTDLKDISYQISSEVVPLE